jgi:hypothetical protein
MQPSAVISSYESGSSEAASELSAHLNHVLQHYSDHRLNLLIPEILSVIRNARLDAGPAQMSVAPQTAAQAIRFAVLLPKSEAIPEISADPDGEISFDWASKSGRMFSVSIDAGGRLAYAGRFGENSKTHGIEQLSDFCPAEILRGIERTTG